MQRTEPGPSVSYLINTGTRGTRPRLMQTSTQWVKDVDLLAECQHVYVKEVRDECLATVKHDLLYNVAMENREFADLLLH
jgi:hypothetical protein